MFKFLVRGKQVVFLEHSITFCWTGHHQDILGTPWDSRSASPSASHKEHIPCLWSVTSDKVSGTTSSLG